MDEELNISIESWWSEAQADEYPKDDALLACVYAHEEK
jgi:hypothetical protein